MFFTHPPTDMSERGRERERERESPHPTTRNYIRDRDRRLIYREEGVIRYLNP